MMYIKTQMASYINIIEHIEGLDTVRNELLENENYLGINEYLAKTK